MSKNEYLECGKIVNTHGVKGCVRVESWCDTPKILASLSTIYFKKEDVYQPTKVVKGSVQKEFALLELEGITDMDEAARLKGTIIYAHRQNLPALKNSFYIADLIGLPVIDADNGKIYGKLTDVENHGANDLYEVKTEVGIRYIPAVLQFIDHIDLETGIFVHTIEGLLD